MTAQSKTSFEIVSREIEPHLFDIEGFARAIGLVADCLENGNGSAQSEVMALRSIANSVTSHVEALCGHQEALLRALRQAGEAS